MCLTVQQLIYIRGSDITYSSSDVRFLFGVINKNVGLFQFYRFIFTSTHIPTVENQSATLPRVWATGCAAA